MPLLSRLEDERKFGAIWYKISRQSPKSLTSFGVRVSQGGSLGDLDRQRDHESRACREQETLPIPVRRQDAEGQRQQDGDLRVDSPDSR